MEAHLQTPSHALSVPRPAAYGAVHGAQRPVRLLDQVRWQIRQLQYSRRTEDAYVYRCRAFIRFHGLRHPAEMGGPEIEAFLGWVRSAGGKATGCAAVDQRPVVVSSRPHKTRDTVKVSRGFRSPKRLLSPLQQTIDKRPCCGLIEHSVLVTLVPKIHGVRVEIAKCGSV
jgi:hypothetical protein